MISKRGRLDFAYAVDVRFNLTSIYQENWPSGVFKQVQPMLLLCGKTTQNSIFCRSALHAGSRAWTENIVGLNIP